MTARFTGLLRAVVAEADKGIAVKIPVYGLR
jgi:hypothetical protein